jgi:hypothetical protein
MGGDVKTLVCCKGMAQEDTRGNFGTKGGVVWLRL